MFKKLAVAALLGLLVGPAWAQNPQCPTRPVGDSSKACANTEFVGTAIAAIPLPLPPIDVFLVIGDSNAVGQGSSASSPLVQTGQAFAYCANGTVVAANDPSCSAVNVAQNANTGSMWPALAISYGRRIGFVLTGLAGSTQANACDLLVGNGNWQDTTAGSNYAKSLTAINAALTAYTAAGYTPTLRGIIYILGSNDAAQINASVCTSGQYTTALTAMIGNYRGATIGGTTYPHMEFWMPIIGTNVGASDVGYSQVRAAQLAWAASDGNTAVPFVNMFSFNARGLMNSGAHPTQAGYNIMGTAIGSAMIPAIPASIPYRLYSANAGIGGAAPAGTLLQLIGADAIQPFSLLDAYAQIPTFQLRRADTTLQAPSAVQNNDTVGVFGVQTYGASTFGTTNQGALLFSATQTHTDTAKGTQACLYTTANGAASPTCYLIVGQNGFINVGNNSTSDALLTINNNTGATSPAAQAGTLIHMVAADAANGIFAFDMFGNSVNANLGIFQSRLAGGTRGTPTAAPAAAYVFNIQAQGYDGVSAYGGLADIGLKTINQTSTTDHSGQVVIRTVAPASTTLTQRMLIDQGIIIGTSTADPGASAALFTPQAFVSLTACAAGMEGAVAEVNNSNTATWGATIAGGGANKVLAHCNGTNWTVMGN